MSVVLGIAPGANGAIAVLTEDGKLAESLDMPSTMETNGRTAINAPLLAYILARIHTHVRFFELARAHRTDPKVLAFALGRARGVIEGCANALGLPIAFLTAPTWKRLADIPPGAENKDVVRTWAIAPCPARADLFSRKCDTDRAEACLIALADLQREGRHV